MTLSLADFIESMAMIIGGFFLIVIAGSNDLEIQFMLIGLVISFAGMFLFVYKFFKESKKEVNP